MIHKAFLTVALAAICFAPAQAADLDPASTKQLHDYVIAMPKVQAYEKAHERPDGSGQGRPIPESRL